MHSSPSLTHAKICQRRSYKMPWLPDVRMPEVCLPAALVQQACKPEKATRALNSRRAGCVSRLRITQAERWLAHAKGIRAPIMLLQADSLQSPNFKSTSWRAANLSRRMQPALHLPLHHAARPSNVFQPSLHTAHEEGLQQEQILMHASHLRAAAGGLVTACRIS
jgi:hypothetical protein